MASKNRGQHKIQKRKKKSKYNGNEKYEAELRFKNKCKKPRGNCKDTFGKKWQNKLKIFFLVSKQLISDKRVHNLSTKEL